MGNLTVNSGSSITIKPNSVIRFPANISLTMNGKLTASGTPSNPIYFTSLSGSGTYGSWGSIILNGTGAHQSKISNAIIKFGTEVRVNYVQTPNYWFVIDSVTLDTMITAIRTFGSNGWVMNSKINYPRDHGVVAENGSTIACYFNKFKKADYSGAAIYYINNSGDLVYQNDISGFNWGLGALYGAYPTLGHSSNTGRNNRITNCLNGLNIYGDARPVIGYDGYFFTQGNSIFNNINYNAVVYFNTPSIPAYSVYWDSVSPPNPAKFSIDAPFYYNPWSTTNSWQGIPLLKSGSSIEIPSILSENKLKQGIKLRESKKYNEAVEYFKSYIAANPKEPDAYIELFKTYNDTTADEIINAFASLHKDAPSSAKFLLSTLQLRAGEVEAAKQTNNALIATYPNSAISARAMLNNFNIALYDENDRARAEKILKEVMHKPELSTEMELSLARHSLETFVPLAVEDRKQLRKQSQAAINALPTRFELSQNYPNPFNPSTTISYSIIEPSDVTLTMYDYLGREVETIVNGYRDIGKYSVNFNASNLASGMYFYKFVAQPTEGGRKDAFTAVKKMLLLK